MKHRSVITVGGAAVILIVITFIALRLDVGDIPVSKASAIGEILSPLGLASSERIVIDYTASGCRTWHHWTFVVLGGTERRMAVVDEGRGWDGGVSGPDQLFPVGAITLSARECKGLDDLFRLYRNLDDESGSTSTDRIRIEYFRGAECVGREDIVDTGQIDNWIYMRSAGLDGYAPPEVTPECLSLAELMRRVEEANQSSEPTSGLRPRAAHL